MEDCSTGEKRKMKKLSELISIKNEEITEFVEKNDIDAIVNAASPTLMGSDEMGVDKAIHEAIDKDPQRRDLSFNDIIRETVDKGNTYPKDTIRCQRGKVIVTEGEPLCNYVMHVVGIKYDGKKTKKERSYGVSSSCVRKLEQCYTEIVREIRKHPDITTVAIPIISAGNYGFPFKLAARIAIASLGNALLSWRSEDPEMFDRALLNRIYFCVYNPDPAKYDANFREAKKIWKEYALILSRNHRVVYQNSFLAHIRYMVEIKRYDEQRGYFSVTKGFRFLLLLLRIIFMPIVQLKDGIGKYDWQKRRIVVEWVAFIKLLLPAVTLIYIFVTRRTAGADLYTYIVSGITLYMMLDTLTYLLVLIVHADIQRPSANIIRSLTFLFINYVEVSLEIALLIWLGNSHSIKVVQAVQVAFLPDVFLPDIMDKGMKLVGNIVAIYLNYGVKFFFISLAFGYFAGNLRPRKFVS